MNTIQLIKTQVRSLALNSESSDNEGLEFGYGVGYDENENNILIIQFKCELFSSEYHLDLTYEAIFETSEAINQEFKESHFPSINAPAIAYPFLRSFVHTILINSGFKPLILPTINFQKMSKNKNKPSP